MAKIYIKTFGCTLNQYESEIMKGLIKNSEHNIVNNENKADLIIINGCTVTKRAENKFWNYLKKTKDKKIICAGCVAQAEPYLLKTKLKKYSVIGTEQIHNILDIINKTSEGKIIHNIKRNPELNPNKIENLKDNKITEIIPIARGCVGNCSYCITKLARGSLKSFSVDSIIKRFEKGLKKGSREFWITAEDTGAYGKDMNNGVNIIYLLKYILKNINGDYKIRLSMGNPNHFIKFRKELADILKDERMFKFIHLPLQSGSNKILKEMNRYYKKEEFLDLIIYLKKQIPEITISTDVILGFPGETEKDFNETINVIKKTKPDILNINRFSPRPKTKAYELKELQSNILKERSRKMTKLFEKIGYENNKKWLNKKAEVLIDEEGKKGTKTMKGRNNSYKTVVVSYKNKKAGLGEKVNVKIDKISYFDLRGSMI
ncbi:tRNA (N(6)-L-threonylcarbamoyladenosine(37)-C(2))-methylthiotransferase [Candidatus Woesearchaeota archaeon]|nr:tRNA (N(6)-L-threonylcarbamoyladenosine(37)-C(2))-methylthiotransferase [Candidatus Woesearchaeota archaeon]